jgi:septum formation protein
MSKLPSVSVILASASPRRKELLQEMGLEFRTVPSAAAEVHSEDLTAREVALVNAYRKAREVAKKHPDSLVIGADTLVYLDTTLFGKPTDRADAVNMLMRLQGRTHHVITGLCLLHLRSHRQRVISEVTAVTFHPLEEARVREYLAQMDPLDKAGAYAIQDRGHLIVERIAGSYSNVVGLPVERLRQELESWARTE